MNTFKAGTTVSSRVHPDKWIRIEAIDPDGRVILSFPGEPEKGTAMLDAADWREMVETFGISPAPLSPPAP